MRTFGTILLAIIISGFVAGTVQVQLGISFDAHEEFIAVMMLQMVLVLVVATVFGIVLAAGGAFGAIDRAALILVALFVAAVAALEVLTVVTSGPTGGDVLAVLLRDRPILVEITIPGLLAILIQWWWVRRKAKRRMQLAGGAA